MLHCNIPYTLLVAISKSIMSSTTFPILQCHTDSGTQLEANACADPSTIAYSIRVPKLTTDGATYGTAHPLSNPYADLCSNGRPDSVSIIGSNACPDRGTNKNPHLRAIRSTFQIAHSAAHPVPDERPDTVPLDLGTHGAPHRASFSSSDELANEAANTDPDSSSDLEAHVRPNVQANDTAHQSTDTGADSGTHKRSHTAAHPAPVALADNFADPAPHQCSDPAPNCSPERRADLHTDALAIRSADCGTDAVPFFGSDHRSNGKPNAVPIDASPDGGTNICADSRAYAIPFFGSNADAHAPAYQSAIPRANSASNTIPDAPANVTADVAANDTSNDEPNAISHPRADRWTDAVPEPRAYACTKLIADAISDQCK